MSLRNVRILLLALIALEAALLFFGPQVHDHLPAIEAALAAKEKPEWWDDAALGIRYAAWINVGLLIALLLTSQWWTRASTPSPKPPTSSPKPARWFWPLTILAVLTCLAMRLPLASKSLWWDESWVMLQVSHGKWRPDTKKPGEFRFQAHDWKRAAFYYQKPTNHVPMSLAQKASLNVWRKLTGAGRSEFSDLAARAPALLASCAAVLLLALMLRSWGWPWAGVAAAFLLALHPWHIRYGVDARAYALVVPLCVGGMFGVSRILQSSGAKILPWICWGLVEFLWLWAYPNAVLDVTALNVVIAILLWQDKATRSTGLIRLLVTNVFAAMALVQVFLPNVMQALHWAGSENVVQPLNLTLIKSTLSHLILGVELAWPNTVEAAGLVSSARGVQGMTFANVMLLVSVVLAVLLLTRKRRVEKLVPQHWMVLCAPLASSVLFAVIVSLAGSYFYQRFIIAALPCVIAIICVLFAEALAAIPSTGPAEQRRSRSRRILVMLLPFVLAVNVGTFWFAQTRLMMTRPYAPLRDVAGFVGAVAAKAIFVCYGHGHETMPVYLPAVQPALTRADLEKFIAQSRSEQRPLLVIQGHNVHNRAFIPDGFTLLDDRSVFEEVKAFAGIEPEFYFRVFRLK